MDQQLLTRIESPTISAMVNVVSGFKQFVRAIAALPETIQLVKQVRSEDDVRRLIQRIIELSAATHDEKYEHPNDTALAIYLWVLNVTQPAAARAVTPVIRECHGCWWAPRLADLLVTVSKARKRQQATTKVINQTIPLWTKSKDLTAFGMVYFRFKPVKPKPESEWAASSQAAYDFLSLGNRLSRSRAEQRNQGAISQVLWSKFKAVVP